MKEAELLLNGKAHQVENMKAQFKDQVKSVMSQNFVSAGNLEKTQSMPTITFLCKSDDSNGQQKSEYRKINAQDYKP